ncbi:MAG TPA: MATE family efflux transporter, partial [Armatimonadota bacterium]|nr:MATE family efflux transporter [Armatimonadota bacterium]
MKTESEANETIPCEQERGQDLTIGSIPRLLMTFTIPLLIGNMIQAGYGIVNRFWVGRYLGDASMAAVTNTMQVAFILIAIANGLTLSSNILISQFVGARNWQAVRRVVQNSLVLIGTLSIIFLVLGQFLTVPLLTAINVPRESFPIAESYMRLFLLSFPFMFIAFLTTSILRGVGDSITPLIFQGIGVVLAAILDPLLMLGWCGFPRLGLNGTAYSMLITQSLTLVAFFIYLHKKNHIASPDWRHLAIDWQTSKLTLKIGLPAAAQQLLVALGSSFMLRFVNDYHESAAAGFGAASQID